MIIAVVLANEYPLVAGRLNFILQVASYAKENDYLIITNEYFKDHFNELVAGTSERFYRELEMNRLSEEELKHIDFCFIPDELLLLDKWEGSRTNYLLHAFNEADDEVVSYLVKQIDVALKKRGEEKPEFIINCIQTTANIREIAHHYRCPLIPYVFSAIRMPHGYSQTLYMAHISDHLFHHDCVAHLYLQFSTDTLPFRYLSRREIIALIGKLRNMPLMSLINCDGKYEVGYAGEGRHIIPQSYQYDLITDDDIYNDINKKYSMNQVIARLHPIQLKQAGLSQNHMKNDPAAFLLSSKRIATVQSQIAVKAALWNRTVCVYGNALPFSFLMKSSITDNRKVTEKDLNFLLFCYFVPSTLMFQKKYWIWRMSQPTANEIYIKHLFEICNNLQIETNVLMNDNREITFLKKRGLTEYEINSTKSIVCSDTINYDFLMSRAMVCFSDGTIRDYYCLNKVTNNEIQAKFEILVTKQIDVVKLILLDDVDGFLSIKSIRVDGKENPVSSENRYIKKNQTCYEINISYYVKPAIVIEACFEAESFYKKYD